MNRQDERTILERPHGNIQPQDDLYSAQNIALEPEKIKSLCFSFEWNAALTDVKLICESKGAKNLL